MTPRSRPVGESVPSATSEPGNTTIGLRRAIARSLNRSFYEQTDGSGYLPGYGPGEVIVGDGSRTLQSGVVQALCSPGDEVLLLAPYRRSYPDTVHMAGATPVVVPSGPEDGFLPGIEAIEAAMSDRTRLVFLNSPGNPSGCVWTRSRIHDLCELVLAYDGVYLLSDEILAGLAFGGARHLSPVTHSARMRRRTILTAGLGGAHSSGDRRLGFAAIADTELMAGMRSLAACAVSPSADVSGEAVRSLEDRAGACALRIELERRAQRLGRRLGAMGLPALPARGGLYTFANVSSLYGAEVQGKKLESAREVALALQDDAGVDSVAGECFGAPDHVRFSFERPAAELEAACDAIEAFILRHRTAETANPARTPGEAGVPLPAGTDVLPDAAGIAAETVAAPSA